MITEFTLNNFRNHHHRHFSTDAPIILFTGDNGVGKTNCLEALSYLTAGRGLRHAKAEEILPQYPKDAETALMGWGVQAQVKRQKYQPNQHHQGQDSTKLVKIATGFAPHQHKRHIFIDGVKQASQTVLDDYVRMLWYIPQMARLFHDGRSGRLRLIDRIATLFDARHYGRLQAYDQQMRERLLVLMKHGNNNQWLDVLENDMARRAVSIATTRSQMVTRLNQCAQTPLIKEFPKLTLTLQGEVENKCDLQNAARSEDDYAQLLHDYRAQDLQEQRTHFGIHRSDVLIGYYPLHSPNRMMPSRMMKAQLCSTGEQKMIIMALILTQLQLLLQEESIPPLLLLDDIAAHLDKQHVTALLQFLRHANVQLFLTGTKDDFLSDLSVEYLHYALDISE